MSVTVKRAVLWRTETRNNPGVLAQTLRPLAGVHQDLQLVMGYAYPDRVGAAIEVYPISGRSAVAAAKEAGLSQSNLPCLTVTGENRPGLSHDITRSLAEARVNLSFFVAQVIGTKYTALFGFEASSEADLAAKIIRKATSAEAAPRRARNGSTKTGLARKQTARRTRQS